MKFTIWDSPEHPPTTCDGELLYTWNGYVESGNILSLFKFIEKNDDLIRSKYLAWVYELGAFEIKGKKIVDYFTFEDGFSYWWMTLFVEKSPWTQPSIIDAIRLFALNEIINKEKPKTIKLVSPNPSLNLVIKNLCKELGVVYSWQKSKHAKSIPFGIKNIYRLLPLPIQSFIATFIYLFNRWPLREIGKIKFEGGENAIFFCSYFFNLEAKKMADGIFYSKQWGELPELIQKQEIQKNWLQLYYAYDDIPNAKKAVEFARKFNKILEINGFHSFLDTFLSFKLLLKVIRNYCKLLVRTKRLGNVEKAFIPKGTVISLWPIMKKDWARTLIGPLAIHNLFYLSLFDKGFSSIPQQKKGLFLFENLSWESAFIYMWRKHGHGQLVAVAHSTVRYWDTRYFFDSRAILSKDSNRLPQADFVALNGKLAIDNFIKSGYPKEEVVECEALRYLHFGNTLIKRKKEYKKGEPLSILILGDYMPTATINMLKILQEAVVINIKGVEFTLKPHPNYPVYPKDYPILNLGIVTDQLHTILNKYDMAVSSNMTSASVDASLAGLPVIIILENSELNFSPLRGNSKAIFVSNAAELSQAIHHCSYNFNSERIDELFFLDQKLPRWKKILAS